MNIYHIRDCFGAELWDALRFLKRRVSRRGRQHQFVLHADVEAAVARG